MRRITWTGLPAPAGRVGPTCTHWLPLGMKRPGRLPRVQVAPTTGVPAPRDTPDETDRGDEPEPNCPIPTAVILLTPQAVAEDWTVRECSLTRRCHETSPPPLAITLPPAPRASAMAGPPAGEARASGTAGKPVRSTPVDHVAPSSAVAARGETVRSCEGRKPATAEPPAPCETTSPPLLATPGGVATAQCAPAPDRVTNCQKVLSGSWRSPMASEAHVADEDDSELVKGMPGGTSAGTPPVEPGEEHDVMAHAPTEIRLNTLSVRTRRARRASRRPRCELVTSGQNAGLGRPGGPRTTTGPPMWRPPGRH